MDSFLPMYAPLLRMHPFREDDHEAPTGTALPSLRVADFGSGVDEETVQEGAGLCPGGRCISLCACACTKKAR